MMNRLLSPLTRRILTVNILPLAILVAGILYLDEYREGLIVAKLAALGHALRVCHAGQAHARIRG